MRFAESGGGIDGLGRGRDRIGFRLILRGAVRLGSVAQQSRASFGAFCVELGKNLTSKAHMSHTRISIPSKAASAGGCNGFSKKLSMDPCNELRPYPCDRGDDKSGAGGPMRSVVRIWSRLTSGSHRTTVCARVRGVQSESQFTGAHPPVLVPTSWPSAGMQRKLRVGRLGEMVSWAALGQIRPKESR